jgi:hypothetical protein
MPENVASVFVSGCGMMIVAAIASLFWWRFSQVQVRWFWGGAGLWTIAVFPKVVCSIVTDVYKDTSWFFDVSYCQHCGCCI